MAISFWSSALFFLTACSVAVIGQQVQTDRLELMQHSFDSPLTYQTNLDQWLFGGASVATKGAVVLVPGVPGRSGHFWHKEPVKTKSFELEFQFSVTNSDNSNPTSQGFAFWYSEDPPELPPVPSDDAAAPQPTLAPGWDLFGNKNPFKGLAVFFSLFDRENNAKSSVSVAANDGTRRIDMKSEVPTESGVYFAPVLNAKDPLIFKLSVSPSSIHGQLRLSTRQEWSNCFKLDKPLVSSSGFIGFTAFTPSGASEGGGDQSTGYEKISIDSLHVYNLDLTRPGEDSPVLAETFKDIEVKDLLSDKHSNIMPDVAHELRQLSRLVYKHISEQQPRENNIVRQQVAQSEKIDMLIGQVRELVKRVDHLAGSGKPNEQVTNELQGLRNLFHSQTKHQENLQVSLSSLQKTMNSPTKDLSEFAERSAALEATIKQQATFSSWMIFGLIIMVAMFALFMWKRMRDMEKKHFL